MGEGTVLVPAAHGGRFGHIPDPEGVDGSSLAGQCAGADGGSGKSEGRPLQGRHGFFLRVRGQRAPKPCPCPRLFKANPSRVKNCPEHDPPCSAEDVGHVQPVGRGGTARRRGPHVLLVVGVRGLFADDAFVALSVCGTLDFDGALLQE